MTGARHAPLAHETIWRRMAGNTAGNSMAACVAGVVTGFRRTLGVGKPRGGGIRMLVTDMALLHMDQGSRSVALGLRRLFRRWRRHRPIPPIPIRPFEPGSGLTEGQERVRVIPSTGSPPPREETAHRHSPIVDVGSTRTDMPGSEVPFKWRRHPQLRDRDRDSGERSTHDLSRIAEAAALRGLFLARAGRLGEARAAFALAATDPSTDLTELPGFWHLSRGAMLIAAVAYEDVERFRDASALSARIRTRYRPRALAPVTAFERQGSPGGSN